MTTRAVFYGRCSTDRQENSVADQRKHVLAHAAKHGYRVVREYADDGWSGNDPNRPDFNRMVKDAADRRDFELILVWSLDRFGRFDVIDAGRFVAPLRDAGVSVETLDKGRVDWNDFTGRLLLTIELEGSKEYLLKLSRNVLRSMHGRAARGFFLGGPVPFGYRAVEVPPEEIPPDLLASKRPPRKLVPGEPHKVEVVQWLFRTYATKDCSLAYLAKTLMARAVDSPNGKPYWTRETVGRLLRTRLYVGDSKWNDYHQGGYHRLRNGTVVANGHRAKKKNGSNRQRSKVSKDDVVIVADNHPALIDRDTFATVQAKLSGRKTRTTPQAGGGDWLLSGLLVCGHCGFPMHAATNANFSSRGTQQVWRRYRCAGYVRNGICHFHWVDEAPLVAKLREKLVQALDDTEILDDLDAEKRRLQGLKTAPAPRLVRNLKAKLAALDAQIATGTDRLLLVPPEHMSDASARLAEWKRQREALAAELDLAENGPARAIAEVEKKYQKVKADREEVREALNSTDPAKVRAAMRTMFAKIQVWWNCNTGSPGGRKCSVAKVVPCLIEDDGLVTSGGPFIP